MASAVSARGLIGRSVFATWVLTSAVVPLCRRTQAAAAGPAGCPRLAGPVTADIVLTIIVCTAAGFLFWWIRERRLAERRRGVRALYSLSEEIISARSPADVVRRLSTSLPQISRVSGVRFYLYNRHTNTLDLQVSSADSKPVSLPVDDSKGPPVCFRNRTLLTISDTRRSPVYDSSDAGPSSVMFVPMQAENETLGVLEIDHTEGVRHFNQDQQAAAQHLGNQIAISLKLLEQQSIREQLFRSEKLAAAGQLVSGVVNELQDPLDAMATRATLLETRHEDSPWKKDLQTIAAEAKRASEIVSRLVSFSRTEKTQAKPVELNDLLIGLMRIREREWEVRGVRVTKRLSPDPLFVLAARAQLEQVFLNLLIHAEQSMADVETRTLTVGTGLLGQRVLVEISYSAPASGQQPGGSFVDGGSPEVAGLGLAVGRGIVQSHGGEIRFTRDAGNLCRFEVELPPAPAATPEAVPAGSTPRKSKRQLTILLAEPQQSLQHRLTALLSARGHRVVPVASGAQAADLTQRHRFDIVFCSASLPGSNWIELRERIIDRTGAFVLLSEGMEGESAADHGDERMSMLRSPVEEGELNRLISLLESRLENPSATHAEDSGTG